MRSVGVFVLYKVLWQITVNEHPVVCVHGHSSAGPMSQAHLQYASLCVHVQRLHLRSMLAVPYRIAYNVPARPWKVDWFFEVSAHNVRRQMCSLDASARMSMFVSACLKAFTCVYMST